MAQKGQAWAAAKVRRARRGGGTTQEGRQKAGQASSHKKRHRRSGGRKDPVAAAWQAGRRYRQKAVVPPRRKGGRREAVWRQAGSMAGTVGNAAVAAVVYVRVRRLYHANRRRHCRMLVPTGAWACGVQVQVVWRGACERRVRKVKR